ncbi:lysophospholipid acyltransferase family protein [Acinetobacter sp. ANC 5414]|uniref:lysophospholipid acyltransferase family protein n=1 Tax=Acinetobacter sp. ANC 5414 TaxID=2731251 RepID=UPI001490152E|nr:lysophospholipid acyltransferase family protein [Acinetobacter sp. ANC 5414]NNH02256.1 lysophospholipid acyltransferase family protein [Acinetobacter sp. ANC 5414]
MYFLFKVVSLLPLCVLQLIASWIAILLNSYNSSMKRVSSINLKLAYPELNIEQHQALLKTTLKSQCLTYIESIKIWGMPQKYNVGLIKNTFGEQHLTEALNNKKGVIVVIAHFGCWELLNAWLNLYTAPMIMYKPNKHKSVDRFILEARQRLNATLVPTDENGVRAIFKHLKQGGLTVILPDHLPKASGGIYSEFFGQKTLSTTLVSKLASKTQCNVIGLSCIRDQKSEFNVHCLRLSDNILSKDLQNSVDCLNQNLEEMINVSPEQYIWSYKRFRKVDGNKNLYTSSTI